MGKYLDMIEANRRARERDKSDKSDLSDKSHADSCDAGGDSRKDTFSRLGRLDRPPSGIPHPVYGHDEFSRFRLTHPAISKERH